MCEAAGMSGHTYTHTYTQDNYSNPRCACAPRVNKYMQKAGEPENDAGFLIIAAVHVAS